MLNDAVANGVRDAVLGILKYREVVPEFGQNLFRVCSEAAQDVRYRNRGRHADNGSRFRVLLGGLSHTACLVGSLR